MNKNESWTEKNQKAEYIGGAIGGGCAIILFVGIVLFVIAAYATCSNGC